MKPTLVFLGLALAAILPSCGNRSTVPDATAAPDPTPAPTPVIELGDPLDDLNAAELAAFERGREVFLKRFKPSEGLGPMYNASSCKSCHSAPVPGGSSDLYRNFYVASYGQFPFLLWQDALRCSEYQSMLPLVVVRDRVVRFRYRQLHLPLPPHVLRREALL